MSQWSKLLFEILTIRFSEPDLRELCFSLGIEYDNLSGRGKREKILDLISYIENRKLLSDLIRQGKRQRNDIDWNKVLESLDAQDRIHYPPEPLELDSASKYIRDNLPRRQIFCGRETELVELDSHLADSSFSVVLIHGIGGVGKSALALEVAHRLLENSLSQALTNKNIPFHFDTFVWISARRAQPSLANVVDIIARTLDLEYLLKIPEGEREYEVNKVLRSRRCLIIVDSFESTFDSPVAEFLLNLPADNKAIVTSRYQTLRDAVPLHLKGLAEPDALLMIRSEAKRLKLRSMETLDPDTFLDLQRITGGLPLAIKWTLGQVRQQGQTLDRVKSSLTSGQGDVFADVFQNSWSLLSAESQEILTVMSLFADTASRDSIRYVAEIQQEDHLDNALGQLVEMSLVDASDEYEPSKRRYSIHPLTSNFVMNQWAQSMKSAASKQKLMSEYFLRFIYEHNNWGDASGLDALETEIQNLFKVMDLCIQMNDFVTYVNFHMGMYNLLWTRGYWKENLTNGEYAVTFAKKNGDIENAAWIHLESIGWTYFEQGNFVNARTNYELAIEIFEATKNVKGLARACNYLGRLSASESNYIEAVNLLEKGLTYAEDEMSITFLESALGDVRYALGDYNVAYTHYEKVKNIREATQDNVRLCSVICDLGDMALLNNDSSTAREHYTRSLEIAQNVKRLSVVARSHRGLAEVEIMSRNLVAADKYAKLACEAFLELGAEREYLRAKRIHDFIQNESLSRSSSQTKITKT